MYALRAVDNWCIERMQSFYDWIWNAFGVPKGYFSFIFGVGFMTTQSFIVAIALSFIFWKAPLIGRYQNKEQFKLLNQVALLERQDNMFWRTGCLLALFFLGLLNCYYRPDFILFTLFYIQATFLHLYMCTTLVQEREPPEPKIAFQGV